MTCGSCGRDNAADARFCSSCGHFLLRWPGPSTRLMPRRHTPGHLADRVRSAAVAEGERKHVTVLFADLRNSMELLAARDPEEARAVLDPVLELMMAAVHQYDGLVNQVMGDGIMALFGAPLALEDHAVRAAFAALRMQESARAYAAQLPKALGTVIGIRVGLNSGEVVVRSIGSDLRMDYTAVGQTTHLASRMEQAAAPGSILVTPDTAALVGGYVVLEPLGPMRIKGLEAPMEVFEITGAGQARSRLQAAAARGLTPFVGRTGDLQVMIAALEHARAAHGQLVCVGGEAGVGKSRLLWEFIHSEHTQGCLLLEGQAGSYTTGASYAPIIDLLRKYFEIEERQDHEAIRVHVASRLQARDRSLQAFVPAFLALLDVPVHDPGWAELDPLLRRARSIEGIRRLLVTESERQPVVLTLEDLHWADSETHAVLDAIIETLPNSRILLLASYRPEYHDAWSAHRCHSFVRLDPLPPASVETLLSTMLGDDAGLERLKDIVREQAAGNPLFLEESVRALVETEALTGARGAYRLSRPVSAVQIPPSVLALIAARIDRLPERDKQLLQSAAVIGKDVPAALLVSIAGLSPDDLRTSLGRLQGGEFLYERSLFPDLEYTFKHALTHEVAYGSLLKDRRRALHGQIVDAVTAVYGDRLPEHVERLAHHARQSERWTQAVDYCWQAGRKAMARSANREAVTYFDQALSALASHPDGTRGLDKAFDIRLDLRSALIPLGEFPRIFQTLHELESLAEQMEDVRRQGLVAALMAGAYPNLGRSEQATAYGERARQIARATGDAAIDILANTYLGASYYFLGKYQQSVECTRRVVTLLPRERSHESFGVAIRPAVFARGFLCWSLSEQGHLDEAEEVAREALDLAEAVGHPQTVVAGLLALGTLYVRRGDVALAIAPFERARELCHRHDVRLWKPIFAAFLGYSLALSARFADAELLLREALDEAELMRLGSFHSQMILWLSEARLLMGAVIDAEKLADDALESTHDKGEAGLEPWALRLVAEVSTHREPLDVSRAEELYYQAMRQAERLGAHPLVARCHLDLGRLHRRAGEDQEARHHLATAAVLFREMKMRLWSDRAEAELRRLPGEAS
jgi:class 3 adenylate cyclase/tetratricopeptide (TPR) repeat protein